MASKRAAVSPAVKEQLAKEERARLLAARVRVNKKIMAGVKESLDARAGGDKGITLEDLKKQMGE
jgi:hypothetical protein